MGSNRQIIINDAVENREGYVPSSLQPDTLFHFMSQLKWLLEALENRMLSARYCCEDISDFKISGLKRVAYPMKCFCDINLHKMKDHIASYGPYGIAFDKKWGMEHGIQPVQYINTKSSLCEDMSEAMGEDIAGNASDSDSIRWKLESLLLFQLMYWKPCYGKQMERLSGELKKKCFTDEFEWRFIPDMENIDMPRVLHDENIPIDLDSYSESIAWKEQASLVFCYEDIKHVILKDYSDYKVFMDVINAWEIDESSRGELLSKVIIWDDLKEDL